MRLADSVIPILAGVICTCYTLYTYKGCGSHSPVSAFLVHCGPNPIRRNSIAYSSEKRKRLKEIKIKGLSIICFWRMGSRGGNCVPRCRDLSATLFSTFRNTRKDHTCRFSRFTFASREFLPLVPFAHSPTNKFHYPCKLPHLAARPPSLKCSTENVFTLSLSFHSLFTSN